LVSNPKPVKDWVRCAVRMVCGIPQGSVLESKAKSLSDLIHRVLVKALFVLLHESPAQTGEPSAATISDE
jgi:hypothetical protein